MYLYSLQNVLQHSIVLRSVINVLQHRQKESDSQIVKPPKIKTFPISISREELYKG